jgi:hypothetical protein
MVRTDQAVTQERPDILDILMAGGLALFLALLPFHLVIKKVIPGPVGTYWKEALLGLLVVLWAIRCLRARRLLLTKTPLDGAVLLYLAVLLLRFALDRSGWVGAWGLYASVMYLPLFWLVPTVLRRCPAWTMALIALLVGVGAVVALGGLVEFVLNVPLWPSDEMVQRQGFPSVFIYGTHIRRVYFTFDSPTTLANTLAMLLPLALSLVMISKRWWARLAAGLAAALIAACIVVTFSRGIWVATVLSLVVMAVLHGLVRRRWRALLVVGGALALLALAWGVAMVAGRGWEDPTYVGVVELSPAAYEAAPVTRVSQELLLQAPAYGQAITQTWTLPDPIAVQDDARLVLYHHPPDSDKDEIIYPVRVPMSGALRFSIALAPETWSPAKGDGASFQVHITDPDAPEEGQFVFVRYINPKHNPSDRRWRNFLVDLSPWAGRSVNLSLITEAGPAGDWAFDWAGWADLQVVGVAPDYFASTQTEDAVLRHTRSIMDWAQDETNRDRLAAWSLALNAWRAAPLWGQGLGSTGVAALRTQPERAFVTESQVLKALVELGPLGLLALAYLWFQIGRVGYRALRATFDGADQTLLLGILTSLLVVLIEGLVYQNLEVKQVNAYYWTLVGTLAFLAWQVSERRAG